MPYESQPIGSRKCGAYCARMVLRGRGISNINAEAIWKKIKSRDKANGEFIKSHALVKELLKLNQLAIAITSKNPIAILDNCISSNTYAILGCRNSSSEHCGHFMVLVNTDKDYVTVHDPHPDGGKNRNIPKKELEKLFIKINNSCELPSGLLILISNNNTDVSKIGRNHECPKCKYQILNIFTDIIGEFYTTEGHANELICPKCDMAFIPN